MTGILFAVLPAVSLGAETVLEAGCPSVTELTVGSRLNAGGLVLSLPGFWDAERITLRLGNAESFCVGPERTEIRAGEETDLRPYIGQTVYLYRTSGKTVGKLTIHRGSAIPALFLTVDSKQLGRIHQSKEREITEGRAVYIEADGTIAYDGAITQMKGRGQNTFGYPKKPYQIKLEKKASLSGMSAAKTWVLLANWNDISLTRNQIMLDICRSAGLRYTPACVPADVWINGKYNGLYLITEKIQIKKERVNIRDLEAEQEKVNAEAPASFPRFKTATEKLALARGHKVAVNPEDITGGYIATVEKHGRLRDYKESGFRTRNGLSVEIKEPTYPSREMVEYLGNLVDDMQIALMAPDGVSPETGKHFRDYMDGESWALKFLAEEWCKNYDFFAGSQYFYKDSDERDPLIYAGPAWDYDLSFGNMDGAGLAPDGGYVAGVQRRAPNLYWLLSHHPEFMETVGEMWRARFRPAVAVLLGEAEAAEDSVIRPLAEYTDRIRASAEMNFARWGVPKTTYGEAGGSFSRAAAYLEKWIRARTEWMDGAYGP